MLRFVFYEERLKLKCAIIIQKRLQMLIEEIKKEIVQHLKPLNLDKIILFGSHAYGEPHQDSDIDLYVVTKDDFIPQSWREKNKLYSQVISKIRHIVQEYPTDLIVHTKKMHENFLKLNSQFSKEINSKGIRLL
jgi:predicted nucleotidyltransferase